MKVRSRRSNVQRSRKRGCSPASSVESRSSGGYFNSSNNAFKNTNLKLPHAIFKELSESQQKAVVKWRNDLKNGREVDNDAIKKLLGQESSGGKESNKKSRNQKKRKKKFRANKLNRGTDAQISKTTSEDLRLLMMSDDSDSDVDDNSLESKPVDELKKVAVYKKVRKVRSTANGIPIDEFKYQTILGTGTELTFVDGPDRIVTKVIKNDL